jgi:hypothetical protein
MPDPVRYHFDPVWLWWRYQTSRWRRQLNDPGLVEVEWAAFSPEMQVVLLEPEELARAHAGFRCSSAHIGRRARVVR